MITFKQSANLMRLLNSFLRMRPMQIRIKRAKKAGDVQLEQRLIGEATKKWANYIFDTYGMKINVHGSENLPTNGPVLFIPNHQGYGDIVVMLKLLDGFQTGFIAKSELEKLPAISTWIRVIHGLFIDRGDARKSLHTIKAAINELEQGFSMVIFPEGTRTRNNTMSPFKAGSFKIATKAQVPIIPISLSGSYKLFETQGYIKGDVVDVVVHPPIETAGLSREEIKALPLKVEKIIADGLIPFQSEEERQKTLENLSVRKEK